MPMYNIIEYSDNYSKISGTLWQYCRDEPALTDANDNAVLILMQIMLLLIRLKLKLK